MKRILALVFSVTLVFGCCASVFASENEAHIVNYDDGSKVIWYADGSRTEISAPFESAPSSTKGTLTTITRSTYQAHYDSDGNLEWKYTLTGTFNYTYGVSASCTNASYTKTINNTSWSFSNGNATASGATATGVGTFTKKWLFITTDTVNVNLTLTCDKYGNVT